MSKTPNKIKDIKREFEGKQIQVGKKGLLWVKGEANGLVRIFTFDELALALKAQAKQLSHDHKILVDTILETKKEELKAEREETLKEVKAKFIKYVNSGMEQIYWVPSFLNDLDKLNK